MHWLSAQGGANWRRMMWCSLAVLLVLPAYQAGASDLPSPIHIYLDADRTHNKASAIAIERGLQVALDEVGNQLQGRPVVLIPTDHRGNSLRAKRNMDQAFSDPATLLVMAGMHSPPLIKYRDYINEQRMLTLVPWAAGGPITRYPSTDNWIFRLSVDDTKAGKHLADYAINTKHCKQPHLLLERTPWGASNEKSLSQAFSEAQTTVPKVSWFNWDVSEESARIMLRAISQAEPGCLVFVGNTRDGITIMQAAHSLVEWPPIPIISHWGITGSNFRQAVDYDVREKLQLSFLQSCFSFIDDQPSEHTKAVLARASRLFPVIKTGADIKAPAGFIHAYDLGRLLIAAAEQTTFTDDMAANRLALRNALESLQSPVLGLIKTYQRPFRPFSTQDPDAHEALGLNDLCMAHYTRTNTIELMPE